MNRVQNTMMSGMSRCPNDMKINLAGTCETENELYEATMRTMKSELRLWLLRSLLKSNLATNDIYNFAKKQGLLRTYNKTPNWETMKIAMETKIWDLKMVLRERYNIRATKRKELLEKLDFKSHRLLKKTRKIKKAVNMERQILQKRYLNKIRHYQRKRQVDLKDQSRATKYFIPT